MVLFPSLATAILPTILPVSVSQTYSACSPVWYLDGFGAAASSLASCEMVGVSSVCLTSHFRHAFGGDSKSHMQIDRKSTRLNSSHQIISYAVFCLKKKKKQYNP